MMQRGGWSRLVRRAAPVLVAVWLLLTVSGGRPSAIAQQPPTSDDPLRELAVRLLTPVGAVPPGVAVQPARLLPGELPPNLPLTVPLPPGARLVGSAVRSSFYGPAGPVTAVATEGFEIVLDVPATPAEVVAFYESALTAQGLRTPDINTGFRPGGFLPSIASVQPVFFCRSERGPFVQVSVFERAAEPADVRLHIQSNPGPCAAPPGPPPPPFADPLPPLTAPAGVVIGPVGSGGSPFSATSGAVARTVLSVTELEAHYARQLNAARWTRTAGGAEGPLAWSVWRVPAGEPRPGDQLAMGERQGFLTVLQGPAADQRTLHIQITSSGGAGTTTSPEAVVQIAPPPSR